MKQSDKIYVAGHRGMVGSAIVRLLQAQGYHNLVLKTKSELDLTNQVEVAQFFEQEKPNYVFLAAAKVGGIYANNTYPADFIYQNLMIESNIIHSAYQSNVRRLLFLGSSCIYPKFAKQPMSEQALLTGILESTNEPYAIAKIAGIKLCESYNRQYNTDFRSVMPTNLYGQGDNFHPENSHVMPALIRRFHEAKQNNLPNVIVWGSGRPCREFLHVDDMAKACVYVMQLDKAVWQNATSPMCSHLNVGYGSDISIKELAEMIKEVVGYQGCVVFDESQPDGTMRKLLDTSRLNHLGWRANIELKQGIVDTYQWYQQQVGEVCER